MAYPSKKKPSTYITDVTVTAITMIENKEFNSYNLYLHLLKHKGKDFKSPLELVSNKGHNLLHEIVDKGRLSMLIVIVIFGWWKMLSEQKVPDESSSEHKGRTPKEIADHKRTRKAFDDVKQYSTWEDNLTPLMKACRSGDVAKVKSILNKAEAQEIFFVDSYGWNALFWAIANGSQELLKLLLDAGLDASVKSKKGETLLHMAAMFGKSDIMETLIKDKRCNLDPYAKDIQDKTPYDKVAENGDITSLETMIKCGHKPKPDFLVLTAFYGRHECVEYCLVTLKMDVNGVDIYNRSALHRACENNKQEIGNLLLTHGARMDLETSGKRNILHILAESGSVSMAIEYLKKMGNVKNMINKKDRYNGVDLCFLIRGRDRGRDAYHYVEVKRSVAPIFHKRSRHGQVDVAQYGTVIKSGWGINPDAETLQYIEDMFKERRLNQNAEIDMTPLHIAAFKGHLDLVKLLLENGARANEKDKFGMTPLMLACGKGHLQIVQQLEKAGAGFEERSNDGQTVVEIAKENEQDKVITYIKGRSYYDISEDFATAQLKKCRSELCVERLNEVRSSGEDVKRHIVSVLRDLRIDINLYLEKIGSDPVLQASEG